MAKRKVYVITQGDYSDYKIIAIYSSRQFAEAHIERQNLFKAAEGAYHSYRDDLELEVWDLNQFNPFGKQWYRVVLHKNGDLYLCEAAGFKATDVSSTKSNYTFIWEGSYAKELGIRVRLLAKTLKQAIKAANEWRIRELAFNQWGIVAPDFKDLWCIYREAQYEVVSGKDFQQGSKVRFFHDSAGVVTGTITYAVCDSDNGVRDHMFVNEDE